MRKSLICTMLFMAACSNRNSTPRGIIPPDSMQTIMFDVVIASSYAAQHITTDTLNKNKLKSNQDLLEEIFKIHHISRDDFKKSLAFYESRPDMSKRIFDSLSVYTGRHQKDLYQSKPNLRPPHSAPKTSVLTPK